MNRNPSSRWLFLFLSLLLHALLLTFLLPRFATHHRSKAEKIVLVKFPSQKLTIADIPKPAKEEKPDAAKAAALYDQKVKKEQTAKSQPLLSQESGEETEKETPSQSSADNSASSFAKRHSQGALPQEFYPDYSEGPYTYINALRYPNIAYFVELKRRFKTAFNPIHVIRQHANQISQGKIEVVLGVTVNAHGELADLIVLRPSPISDYDDVALRTVKNSSPFSSPPNDLLDTAKLLRMSWTFTVYL